MKKIILFSCLILFLISMPAYAQKFTLLPAGTALTDDDIIPYVDAPGGSAVTKKITFANFKISIPYQPLDSDLTAWGAITAPTVAAAGDVIVGSGANALTVITKGANNSIFGVNNSGTLGFSTTFTPVLTAAPASDDTYTGTIATFTAGEALAQWDVVYCKNKAGVHACYKYDADATDKAEPPRAVATAAINADAAGVFLLEGIVRNDEWTFATTNQDEGKKVYADTTAGAITDVEPAQNGVVVGYVVEEDVVYFKFAHNQASTGSGQPVKATSPTLTTPDIGAATATSVTSTGIVDGLLNITVTTSTPISVGGAGKLQGYYLNKHATANTAITYNLPVASAGQRFHIKNSHGAGGANTGVLTVHPVTDTYINLQGTNCTVSYNVVSTGAAGEFIELIGVDATHWEVVNWYGTWACAAP